MDRFIVDDYVSREQELENLKSNMDRFIAVSTAIFAQLYRI